MSGYQGAAESSNKVANAMARETSLRDTLEIMSRVELTLFMIQFLLGMFLNLYANLPTSDPFSAPLSQTLPLSAHILNGFVLLTISVVMVFLASRKGEKVIALMAASTAVFVVLAGLGGLTFLFGGQDDAYSYLMATGFIFAILTEASLLARRTARIRSLPLSVDNSTKMD